jgi:hypothetical protein
MKLSLPVIILAFALQGCASTGSSAHAQRPSPTSNLQSGQWVDLAREREPISGPDESGWYLFGLFMDAFGSLLR